MRAIGVAAIKSTLNRNVHHVRISAHVVLGVAGFEPEIVFVGITIVAFQDGVGDMGVDALPVENASGMDVVEVGAFIINIRIGIAGKPKQYFLPDKGRQIKFSRHPGGRGPGDAVPQIVTVRIFVCCYVSRNRRERYAVKGYLDICIIPIFFKIVISVKSNPVTRLNEIGSLGLHKTANAVACPRKIGPVTGKRPLFGNSDILIFPVFQTDGGIDDKMETAKFFDVEVDRRVKRIIMGPVNIEIRNELFSRDVSERFGGRIGQKDIVYDAG